MRDTHRTRWGEPFTSAPPTVPRRRPSVTAGLGTLLCRALVVAAVLALAMAAAHLWPDTWFVGWTGRIREWFVR